MKYISLWLIVFVVSTRVVANTGMLVNTVNRPYKGYGEWVVYLEQNGENQECRIKNLNKNGTGWVIECADANYRISQTFKDHYKIFREGEKSGYINNSGYFIHTQLDEIKTLKKNRMNHWGIQGTQTILSASFSDMKEWKVIFFDLNGKKSGEMKLTWSLNEFNELKVDDKFPSTSEKQIKHKFLVIFATIISTINGKH